MTTPSKKKTRCDSRQLTLFNQPVKSDNPSPSKKIEKDQKPSKPAKSADDQGALSTGALSTGALWAEVASVAESTGAESAKVTKAKPEAKPDGCNAEAKPDGCKSDGCKSEENVSVVIEVKAESGAKGASVSGKGSLFSADSPVMAKDESSSPQSGQSPLYRQTPLSGRDPSSGQTPLSGRDPSSEQTPLSGRDGSPRGSDDKENYCGGSDHIDQDNFNPLNLVREDWCYFTEKGTEKVHDPKKSLFEPLTDIWERMELLKNSGTGSKKKIILLLTNYFRIIIFYFLSELPLCVFLSMNKILPEYYGVEIGIGESILIKTICETYGRTEQSVKAQLQKIGDLGSIAEDSRSRMSLLFKPQRLSLRQVYTDIRSLAEIRGNSAILNKKNKIKKVLTQAIKKEPKFLIRFLEGSLRIGCNSITVLTALAHAFVLTPPQKRRGTHSEMESRIREQLLHGELTEEFFGHFDDVQIVPDIRLGKRRLGGVSLEDRVHKMELALRHAYSQVPNLPYVLFHLMNGLNADELRQQCVICPGVPVSPMLAKPTKGLKDVLDAMENEKFKAEFKYDGERIQIHKLQNGLVHLFSRNLEKLDMKYPDVKEIAEEAIQEDVEDFIIDAEVVAYNHQSQEILPFQVLSGRKRKDVDVKTLDIQVCLFVFDCLRFNGQVLCETPLSNRQQALYKAVKEIPGRLMFARGGTVTDTTELEALLQEAIDGKTEGLMVKVLEGEKSYYEPSKRSQSWLKLKKDYLEHLGDSIDLVPVGGFYGKGKRSGLFGTYLMCVYDPVDCVYRSACKVATGFSDEDLQSFMEFYKDKHLTTPPPYYDLKIQPDVWLQACQVWEIRAADLSISPVHTAACELVSSSKGIGLRFPRFLKVREDKKIEQASDSQFIMELYEKQSRSKPAASTADGEEEEDEF